MARKQQNDQRIRADSGQHRRILGMMCLFAAVAFLPVAVRLYVLMVDQHEYYAQQALRNQTRTTAVAADRGVVYDRNMNVLASSVSVEHIYLNPRELKQAGVDIPHMAARLAQILDLEEQAITDKATALDYRYQLIAANVPQETASEIRQWILDEGIAGIHLEPGTKRVYPYGTLAAQVIGFTNASNVGSEGVEAAYNGYLQGTPGRVITTKGNNEMDMPFSFERFVASRPGDTVILTLDAAVQSCLERRMAEAIDRYDVQNGAFGMVMEVKTGKILAMATLGSYDPNAYLQICDEETAAALEELRQTYLMHTPGSPAYESGKTAYQQALNTARLKQWRNRCLSDGYEPGSTFKVLTMAAALDSGSIDLQTRFHCAGSARIPGRSQLLHCWRSKGHGSEDTAQALQNSCNIAFANIALKMGGETFYEYIRRFGILEKTGIDLYGESKGVFFAKELITDTDKWGTASLTSGSFGQTFKLTPIQLVRAIASVVNGGNLMEPYIVSEVINSDGKTVLKQEPTVIRRVIREETSETMCRLLLSVVEEGTAKNASVAGFSIGGKTGTSEKIDVLDAQGNPTLDKIVSFVGIAPMDDPEYIVLVALDTPSRATGLYISGGQMAAPTVGAVMADILPYLGVARSYGPEDAAGTLYVLEDLTGLTASQAADILKKQYLTAKTVGSGDRVTGQIPAAGTTVAGDSQVLLYMGEPVPDEKVTVPDLVGMNRQQAHDAAGLLGLHILVTGNADLLPEVVVTKQDPAAGTQVAAGTTIRLEFLNTKATD